MVTLRGHRYNFLNFDVFLSLKVVLIFTNNADPGSSLFAKVSSIQRVRGPIFKRHIVRFKVLWVFLQFR